MFAWQPFCSTNILLRLTVPNLSHTQAIREYPIIVIKSWLSPLLVFPKCHPSSVSIFHSFLVNMPTNIKHPSTPFFTALWVYPQDEQDCTFYCEFFLLWSLTFNHYYSIDFGPFCCCCHWMVWQSWEWRTLSEKKCSKHKVFHYSIRSTPGPSHPLCFHFKINFWLFCYLQLSVK